jgi:hypothetical protein
MTVCIVSSWTVWQSLSARRSMQQLGFSLSSGCCLLTAPMNVKGSGAV